MQPTTVPAGVAAVCSPLTLGLSRARPGSNGSAASGHPSSAAHLCTIGHDRACSCTLGIVLTDERRALILDRLSTQGRVLAADLSAELAVSADTIRRDLRELDDAGLLRRVHGGGLPRHGDASPFAAPARRAPEAKASIARRAAARVRDGQVVVLDGGTSTLELARALREDLRASVITTSPPIALALADHPRLEVTAVGGTLRPHALVAR